MTYRRQYREQQRLFTILGYAVPALLLAAALWAALRSLVGGDLYINWLLAAGLVTCVVFRFDKGQAQRGGQRVPEMALHALTVLGGFLGSAFGMFGFRHRHKVNDPAFWAVLLGSVVLHAILYVCVLR